MSSCSFLLRCLLLFTLMSFFLLDSGAIPQHYHEGFLGNSYQKQMTSSLLKANSGSGENVTFNGQRVLQMEPTLLLENGAQTTQVWPRTMLDYMRQQLRFRGRTKKNSKKGFSWKFSL